MRTRIALVAPWLATAVIGGAIIHAPLAGADTDPDVPYGGDAFGSTSQGHYPDVEVPFDGAAAGQPAAGPNPDNFGEHENNHDEVDDSAGGTDVPF